MMAMNEASKALGMDTIQWQPFKSLVSMASLYSIPLQKIKQTKNIVYNIRLIFNVMVVPLSKRFVT